MSETKQQCPMCGSHDKQIRGVLPHPTEDADCFDKWHNDSPVEGSGEPTKCGDCGLPPNKCRCDDPDLWPDGYYGPRDVAPEADSPSAAGSDEQPMCWHKNINGATGFCNDCGERAAIFFDSPKQPSGAREKLELEIASDIAYAHKHKKGDAWLAVTIAERLEAYAAPLREERAERTDLVMSDKKQQCPTCLSRHKSKRVHVSVRIKSGYTAGYSEPCTDPWHDSPVEGGEPTIIEALKDANEVCRSAYSIAQRQGRETNWDAWTKRVEKALDLQHQLIYPNVASVVENLNTPDSPEESSSSAASVHNTDSRPSAAGSGAREWPTEIDWMQVALNYGPHCFHVEDDGSFCGRAERWDGHHPPKPVIHKYISFGEYLRAYADHCTAQLREERDKYFSERNEYALGVGTLQQKLAAERTKLEQAYTYLEGMLRLVAPVEPLPDLMGVCTQIDNFIVGERTKREAAERERDDYKNDMVIINRLLEATKPALEQKIALAEAAERRINEMAKDIAALRGKEGE